MAVEKKTIFFPEQEELFKERANMDIDAIMSHPDRFSKFGGKDTGCKYFSPD